MTLRRMRARSRELERVAQLEENKRRENRERLVKEKQRRELKKRIKYSEIPGK